MKKTKSIRQFLQIFYPFPSGTNTESKVKV